MERQIDGLTFEEWKERYRKHVAAEARCTYESTAEMVAEDETLREAWETFQAPEDAADDELQSWDND